MASPRLVIEQQPARIGLEINKPRFNLGQQPAQLEISQQAGELDLRTDTVEVRVDSYPHHRDLGYLKPEDRSSQIAREGEHTAEEATVTYARQGDELADIGSSGSGKAIVEQARQASQGEPQEIGLRWKRGPEIAVIPNQLELDYQQRPPEISSQPGSVRGQLERGRVEAYLEQMPGLEISVTGGDLNRLA